MRLLNTTTLELCKFSGKRPDKYAVLSHTWGKEDEEVSFQDLPKRSCINRKGYRKISECCKIAREQPQKIDYLWIDTCCIDKSSSAELSEAINSMYDWYEHATVCYVYLDDVPLDPFQESAWFTRGWTLQELLAPESVEFYDHDWEFLGPLEKKYDVVSAATGISQEHLKNPHLASIAQKMSWASDRETTIPEDVSYCLLGLFQVNMPTLYGEGGSKAFLRLQQEIGKQSDDESLFAWNDDTIKFTGIFAQSPKAFTHSDDVEVCSFPSARRKPWTLTNRGLAIDLPIRVGGAKDSMDPAALSLLELAPLNCTRTRLTDDRPIPFCVRLLRLEPGGVDFSRTGLGEIPFGKGQKFDSPKLGQILHTFFGQLGDSTFGISDSLCPRSEHVQKLLILWRGACSFD